MHGLCSMFVWLFLTSCWSHPIHDVFENKKSHDDLQNLLLVSGSGVDSLNVGLAGYFNLDGEAGTGTINGTVTATTDRHNNTAGAMLFDNASCIDTNLVQAYSNSGIIVGWFKIASGAETRNSIVSQDNSGASNQVDFLLAIEHSNLCTSTGGLTFEADGFSASHSCVQHNANVKDNSWRHAVVVVDGTSASLYQDGVLVQTATLNEAGIFGADGILNIQIGFSQRGGGSSGVSLDSAAQSDGNYFDGAIDEVSIYTRALHASEVARLTSL